MADANATFLIIITTATMGSFIVSNESSSVVYVFVSKYSNNSGDDAWFELKPGARDSWGRNGWEVVAFKNANDTQRAGVYVPVNNSIAFHGFANIQVQYESKEAAGAQS